MRAVACTVELTHPAAAKRLSLTLERHAEPKILAKASPKPGREVKLRPAEPLEPGRYDVRLTVRNHDGSKITPAVRLRVR